MATQKDIRLEAGMRLDFMEEVYALPGGDRVKNCIQCGTCSGSCPASFQMEKTPRQMFAMIRAGMRDDVLSSDTVWLCASCYSCSVRCPQEIKIADVFYAIKRIAIREGKAKKHKAAALSNSFAKIIDKYGRNSETRLLLNYFLKADKMGIFKQMPIGMKLFFKGRLPLTTSKIRGTRQLRAIIAKARELAPNGGSK